MERKLVKQGRNALTITLPSKWIQKNNLTSQDIVYLEEERNIINISSKSEQIQKKITVDFSNLHIKLSLHKLIGLYVKGYDEIIILNPDEKLLNKLNSIQLVGMIISKQDKSKIIFKNLIAKPTDDFEEIFRRSCALLNTLSFSLTKLTQGQITPENVKKNERILDSNLLYCLRYINKYENIEKSYEKFLTIATIEQVADNISQLRKNIRNDVELAENINILIEDYIQSLILQDFNKIFNSINKFKEKLNKDSFAHGYAYSMTDTIINYIGFIL